jgi:bifunctional DNA-binding transcriptional regulator/antitoxin component of YhaV-PrlF toxin-antitoxin module
MPVVTLDHLGRLSLPVDVRRHLKVSTGDSVQFVVDTRGEVCVRACAAGVEALRGILRQKRCRAVGAAPPNLHIGEEVQ